MQETDSENLEMKIAVEVGEHLLVYATRILMWAATMTLWWSERITTRYAWNVRKAVTLYGMVVCFAFVCRLKDAWLCELIVYKVSEFLMIFLNLSVCYFLGLKLEKPESHAKGLMAFSGFLLLITVYEHNVIKLVYLGKHYTYIDMYRNFSARPLRTTGGLTSRVHCIAQTVVAVYTLHLFSDWFRRFGKDEGKLKGLERLEYLTLGLNLVVFIVNVYTANHVSLYAPKLALFTIYLFKLYIVTMVILQPAPVKDDAEDSPRVRVSAKPGSLTEIQAEVAGGRIRPHRNATITMAVVAT